MSDAEWAPIAPLLPNKPRSVAGRRSPVISGLFHGLRSGAPWRDLPERCGPRTTVYIRYNGWAKAGAWARIFKALAERSPGSLHLIDSSIVRPVGTPPAVKGGADHAIGRSRGLTTKIHAVVVARPAGPTDPGTGPGIGRDHCAGSRPRSRRPATWSATGDTSGKR